METVWVIVAWDDDGSDPDVYVFGEEEAADAFFEKVVEQYANATYQEVPVCNRADDMEECR